MPDNYRILVVDDDRDITTVLKQGLEYLGFKVDALNRLSELANHSPSEYDAAVLDIRMPEISGFDLARKLWSQNEKLQICFLSAFEINASEAMKTMPSLKSHCFLEKPILPSVLAKHIETHMTDGRT